MAARKTKLDVTPTPDLFGGIAQKKPRSKRTPKYVAKKASDILATRKRPKIDPSKFRYFVLVTYQKYNGRNHVGACANVYQRDCGHPCESILMDWKSASYTKGVLMHENPSAKYTIHRIYAALQLEPKR